MEDTNQMSPETIAINTEEQSDEIEVVKKDYKPNEPENNCYGEIKMYCGRTDKECHFRSFIESSPSGLIHACLRCKDLRITIDTKSKI